MKMRNLVLATLVLGIALVGLQAQVSANLLTDTDPGFDTQAVGGIDWGTTPWWGGAEYGAASVTDAKSKSPSHSVQLSLYGDGGAWAGVGQTVSGITGNTVYTASAYFQRDADIDIAEGGFKIRWLDSGGGVLRDDTGLTKFNNSYTADTWHLISDQFTSPSDAAGANYQIVYGKFPGADPGDIWADDANLDVIPEPGTIILFSYGILGLIPLCYGRKK